MPPGDLRPHLFAWAVGIAVAFLFVGVMIGWGVAGCR